MAKIILPPIYDKLSGTVVDTRYYTYKNTSCVASYKPYKLTEPSIKQSNQQKAFTILMADYNNLKLNHAEDYTSWVEEAEVLEKRLRRKVTVVQLYTSFFLSMYQAELGQDVEPGLFAGGVGGYGTCRYGNNKYGSASTCTLYHYKDRFFRRWFGRAFYS